MGKAYKLDAFVVQSSCNFPGAVAVPAMYFLVTDQFVHAFGPILNLLSAATSTAAAGSRIWEFLVHSVKKCFLLSALTEFAASFCSYNYRIWQITHGESYMFSLFIAFMSFVNLGCNPSNLL